MIWVSVCMSIGYYGLSDIYGNIAIPKETQIQRENIPPVKPLQRPGALDVLVTPVRIPLYPTSSDGTVFGASIRTNP